MSILPYQLMFFMIWRAIVGRLLQSVTHGFQEGLGRLMGQRLDRNVSLLCLYATLEPHRLWVSLSAIFKPMPLHNLTEQSCHFQSPYSERWTRGINCCYLCSVSSLWSGVGWTTCSISCRSQFYKFQTCVIFLGRLGQGQEVLWTSCGMHNLHNSHRSSEIRFLSPEKQPFARPARFTPICTDKQQSYFVMPPQVLKPVPHADGYKALM